MLTFGMPPVYPHRAGQPRGLLPALVVVGAAPFTLRLARQGRMTLTTLLIAHRLPTIRSAGLIVVLDGGRVAEVGTYEQLPATDGTFARLVAAQRMETPPAITGPRRRGGPAVRRCPPNSPLLAIVLDTIFVWRSVRSP